MGLRYAEGVPLPSQRESSFELPGYNRPLDLDAAIARIPAGATIKGMIMNDLADECTRRGKPLPGDRHWTLFRDYPLSDLLELEVEVGRWLFPGLTLREQLRRVAWTTYPNFVNSLLGRTIFTLAGPDFGFALRLAERAYKVASNIGRVRILEQGVGYTRLQLAEQYNFLDSYQVGIFEGALSAFGLEGDVRIRHLDVATAELELRWKTPAT